MNPDAPCNCVPEKIRLLDLRCRWDAHHPGKDAYRRTCEAVNRLYEAGIAMAITSSRPPRGTACWWNRYGSPRRLRPTTADFMRGRICRSSTSSACRPMLPQRSSASSNRMVCRCGCFAVATGLCAIATARMSRREEHAVQFSPTTVADFADLLGDVVKIVGVSDDLEAVARCEADVRREIGNQVSACAHSHITST